MRNNVFGGCHVWPPNRDRAVDGTWAVDRQYTKQAFDLLYFL